VGVYRAQHGALSRIGAINVCISQLVWEENITIYAYVNGSAMQCIGRPTGMGGTTLASCVGLGTLALTAGDTLATFASQSSDPVTLALYNDGQFNHVAIEKVG